MENKDNTLTEMQEQMQQQMQQLREKLDKQKIVNERILKKSCSQTASQSSILFKRLSFFGFGGLAPPTSVTPLTYRSEPAGTIFV